MEKDKGDLKGRLINAPLEKQENKYEPRCRPDASTSLSQFRLENLLAELTEIARSMRACGARIVHFESENLERTYAVGSIDSRTQSKLYQLIRKYSPRDSSKGKDDKIEGRKIGNFYFL